MPQIYVADPAPPAHGTCRVYRSMTRPFLSQAPGHPEILEISRIQAPEASYSVMEITETASRRGLHRGPFGVLKGQPQLLRERLDRRAAPLPLPLGLEPQIADTAAPRGNHTADGPEVAALGMFLVQPPDDVGGHADEGAQRGRALDAVFAAVPRAAEHERNLLEVVHEELLHVVIESRLVLRTKGIGGEQLLQLLREGRLSHAARSDAEQLDLAGEGRVVTVVQCA